MAASLGHQNDDGGPKKSFPGTGRRRDRGARLADRDSAEACQGVPGLRHWDRWEAEPGAPTGAHARRDDGGPARTSATGASGCARSSCTREKEGGDGSCARASCCDCSAGRPSTSTSASTSATSSTSSSAAASPSATPATVRAHYSRAPSGAPGPSRDEWRRCGCAGGLATTTGSRLIRRRRRRHNIILSTLSHGKLKQSRTNLSKK
mmetsp:Transcript_90560/g.189412  ORF Transcript_90560/g.189412 Transcript_90560/m.189412 type:complete len:207 (+) Transcript_90560:410-1030(+)